MHGIHLSSCQLYCIYLNDIGLYFKQLVLEKRRFDSILRYFDCCTAVHTWTRVVGSIGVKIHALTFSSLCFDLFELD